MPFPHDERRHLLAMPGIGPVVMTRLEQAGFHSLAAIRAAGAERVVEAVMQQVGSLAWNNRRAALERALLSSSGSR